MAVKSNFNAAASLKELIHEGEKIHTLIFESLKQAGEDFVTACRLQPGDHSAGFYEDKTGNLRHSTEFFIFHNGELVLGGGSDFTEQNKAEILDIIRPKGFQLIGMAGMNYATIVESRGYNVASVQGDRMFIDLTEYVKDIQDYVNG